MDRWSVHVAELIGIFYAISMVFKIVQDSPPALKKFRQTIDSDDPV
jgi:hypothetical protein